MLDMFSLFSLLPLKPFCPSAADSESVTVSVPLSDGESRDEPLWGRLACRAVCSGREREGEQERGLFCSETCRHHFSEYLTPL